MVQVSAPSVLPGGYVFDAVSNGQTFAVTVPAGGVSRGQTFSAPFEPGGGGLPASAVPEGRWKDGLCDCCMFGCCHSPLWMAICCRLALLGQVQNRLRLNWLGVRANPGDRSPFKILLGISILVILLFVLMLILQDVYTDPSTGKPIEGSPYWAIDAVYWALGVAEFVFPTYVILKTRRYIRKRSGIPEKSCQGCEDCCCAYWCSCCMVLQMAGHTADYETYAAKCCSETGLPAYGRHGVQTDSLWRQCWPTSRISIALACFGTYTSHHVFMLLGNCLSDIANEANEAAVDYDSVNAAAFESQRTLKVSHSTVTIPAFHLKKSKIGSAFCVAFHRLWSIAADSACSANKGRECRLRRASTVLGMPGKLSSFSAPPLVATQGQDNWWLGGLRLVVVDVPPGILWSSSEYGTVVLRTYANSSLHMRQSRGLDRAAWSLVQVRVLAGAFWMVRRSSGSDVVSFNSSVVRDNEGVEKAHGEAPPDFVLTLQEAANTNTAVDTKI
ncbi:hypothetical protein THAOC_27496 [Thalassiosira oceanica]|uniref:Uncharacterized protein n=1 Tax=Thalassiosira oceanica TaxID=159749 RepID=K0RIS4_THAOC|nr:hypothetical protein THAOC_27496 [Thalassiosira oceanica]|eukprot:EJK53125.1 hypothetical protein THAOC_27496 [Thalassiosira oceanica]